MGGGREEEKGRIVLKKVVLMEMGKPNLGHGFGLYKRETEKKERNREKERDLGSVFKEITESMVGQSISFTIFHFWRRPFLKRLDFCRNS